MDLLSLETIAALRASAANYAENAKKARDTAKTINLDTEEATNTTKNRWETDAATFWQISQEMLDIAAKAAYTRSYGTVRWITRANNGMPATEVRAIIAAIEATPAYREQQIHGGGGTTDTESVTYTIQLIGYYDPTTKTHRWAIVYTDNYGNIGTSDNEHREDAEYWYNELAGPANT